MNKWIHLLLLLLITSSCGPQRFQQKCDPEPPPPFRIPEKIRVALVLGSGGVRGMAHVGVLEVLEKAGIPIDLIVGCSAGSIVGALYAEEPCAAKVKSEVWGMRANSLMDFDLCNCRYGIFQGKSMHHVLDKYLEADTFEDLKIPLVVVATDLHTGELVPIGSGDILKAVRASCSMPFFFVPCEHLGRVLVDGGVINPVPVRVARDLGAEIIIAVDLSEMLEKTNPSNLFDIATRSAEIIFMWHNEGCTRGADVIIRPTTCGVGTFNDKMKRNIYEAGKKAALEKLPQIRELVNKIPPEEWCKKKKWCVVLPECYTPAVYFDYYEKEIEEAGKASEEDAEEDE